MLLMVTTGRRGCGLNYFIVSHLSPEFSRARLERLAPTEVRIHKGPYDPKGVGESQGRSRSEGRQPVLLSDLGCNLEAKTI